MDSSSITYADRFPHVQRVQYELSFEERGVAEDSPMRHVHSTAVLGPGSIIRPLVVRCRALDCDDGVHGLDDGWDLLPVLMEMLAGNEPERCGTLGCQDMGHSCPSDIHYRIVCRYEDERLRA